MKSYLIIFLLSSMLMYSLSAKTLAEDPTRVNDNVQKVVGKPWVGKSRQEVQAWARENLHHKCRGKSVIQDADRPEWQWFRESGLGVFLHWGLASLPPANGDAWAMVWNEGRAGAPGRLKRAEEMFAVAEHWNPELYDPKKWMEAAHKAGFGYAVLTTRHHDGYCLWPSEYGEWDTGEKMGGRDLVRDYVEACRANDIKVGFYYSGPNWHYDYKNRDFSHPPVGMNYRHERVGTEGLRPLMGGSGSISGTAKLERAQSKGQVEELLKNYGAIDILWWDGNSIMKEEEVHELQPKAFVARGNIATPEGLQQGASGTVKVTNEAGWWWEMCAKAENHHTPNWHYNVRNEDPEFHWDAGKLLTELIRCRSLGGNLLVNITPRPNGEMMDVYYTLCSDMAEWMAHSKEAIHGVKQTAPLPMLDKTENFTTVKGRVWYSLPDKDNVVAISGVPRVKSVSLLRTGEALEYVYEKESLELRLPEELSTPLPDLVKIEFE